MRNLLQEIFTYFPDLVPIPSVTREHQHLFRQSSAVDKPRKQSFFSQMLPAFKTWDWHPEVFLLLMEKQSPSLFCSHITYDIYLKNYFYHFCNHCAHVTFLSWLETTSTISLMWLVLLTAGDLQWQGKYPWDCTAKPQEHMQQYLCWKSMSQPWTLLVLWLFPQCSAAGCVGRTELWVMMVASLIPGAAATGDEQYTEASKAAPGRWGSLVSFLISHLSLLGSVHHFGLVPLGSLSSPLGFL